MCVGGDQRLAVRPRLVQVHRGVLRATAERGAVRLAPADDLLLALDREFFPVVQEHPDPPDDRVGAALHPRVRRRVPRRDEDPFLEVALARFRVVGAVDLAHQVARGHRPVRGARGPVEAVHLPPDPGRRTGLLLEGAQRVEGDERVVGTDLNPEIPVGPCGIEVVGREPRQRVQGGWPVAGQTGACEEGPPESEGDGQGGRPGVQGDPGVVPLAVLRRLTGRQPGSDGRPAAHQGGGFGAPRPGRQVEGDQVPPGLKRSGDPRLMFPVKHRLGRADRGQRGRCFTAARGVSAGPACRAQDESCRTRCSRAADQPPPGDEARAAGP